MPKYRHEFRDPIHNFISLTTADRGVVDSEAFQRLRHIHQLAFTFLVYPGATHRRFEHSLGVAELAGRVFDVLTRERPHRVIEDYIEHPDNFTYWRRVVRLGALCHDLGHMPFSHAAEDLIENGLHHEQLSLKIIMSDAMAPVWDGFPVRAADVAKIAVGPSKWPGGVADYTPWQRLMSEIVTGDAFGVDRIDYLLRDSWHAGVAYGRFDHYRLIDTLRILPGPDKLPVVGIERGGIHSAEGLQQARFFMFSQLYLHRVRRAYDLHLRDFLKAWLPGGVYSSDLAKHLAITDNEVLAAIRLAAADPEAPGHEPARRFMTRQHYRVLYTRREEDARRVLSPEHVIYRAAAEVFGDDVRLDAYRQESQSVDFAVARDDDHVVSSLSESEILNKIPGAAAGYVFVTPERKQEARKWLDDHHEQILERAEEERQ